MRFVLKLLFGPSLLLAGVFIAAIFYHALTKTCPDHAAPLAAVWRTRAAQPATTPRDVAYSAIKSKVQTADHHARDIDTGAMQAMDFGDGTLRYSGSLRFTGAVGAARADYIADLACDGAGRCAPASVSVYAIRAD